MPCLTSKELCTPKLKTEKFPLHDYGYDEDDYIYCRELDGQKMVDLTKSGDKSGIDEALVFIRHGCIDEDGSKLFATEDDVRQILKNNISLIMALFNKVLELSGLTDLAEQAKN